MHGQNNCTDPNMQYCSILKKFNFDPFQRCLDARVMFEIICYYIKSSLKKMQQNLQNRAKSKFEKIDKYSTLGLVHIFYHVRKKGSCFPNRKRLLSGRCVAAVIDNFVKPSGKTCQKSNFFHVY